MVHIKEPVLLIVKVTFIKQIISRTVQTHTHTYRVANTKAEQDVALWYEHSLMVRWAVGLIHHGGPIELFLIPASVPQLV